MRSLLLALVVLTGCFSTTPAPQPTPPTPVATDPAPAPTDPSAPPTVDPPVTPPTPPAPQSNLADGAACLESAQCQSGVCEGEGCTDDKPGVCASQKRGCTRDLRAYCGCDGKTFRTSGSCPGKRFSARAECAP